MKRVLLVFGLMLLCTGCATSLSPSNLRGEWQFTGIVEGMAPPRFDKMEFMRKHRLRLTSTLDDTTVETTYSLSAEALTFKIFPPGQPARTETVAAKLGEMGLGLTLQSQGSSLRYSRASYLLHDDVVGTWTGAKEEDTLILTKEGKLHSADQKISGYYRHYRAKVGKLITLVMDIPEHGPFATTFVYRLKGDELELTPIMQAVEIQKNPTLAKDNPPTRLTRKR